MGDNMYASLSNLGGSVIEGVDQVSNVDKLKYEAKIKTLEQKLYKIQEGKLDDADHMLDLQKDNGKLSKDNQTLKDENKDLKERLQEVESKLSDLLVEKADLDDQIEGYKNELTVRDQQLQVMEDKNKKITQECQILTVRILEEKNKMVEIMNEANNMYEN